MSLSLPDRVSTKSWWVSSAIAYIIDKKKLKRTTFTSFFSNVVLEAKRTRKERTVYSIMCKDLKIRKSMSVEELIFTDDWEERTYTKPAQQNAGIQETSFFMAELYHLRLFPT